MEQSFNKVIDLLYSAKQNGVEFILNGEKLQLKVAENKAIDKNFLEEIRNSKSQIIDFLGNENWKSQKVNNNQNEIIHLNKETIGYIPLSFSQERLWLIDKVEGGVQYNLPIVLKLEGSLDKDALE